MKKFIVLLLTVVAAFVAEAQTTNPTNTPLIFRKTYASTSDSYIQVTNSASDTMVVKSWSGSADYYCLQVDGVGISGNVGSFKLYIYPSNDGTHFSTTPMDSILFTNTSGRKTYINQGVPGTKYNSPYLKLKLQGAGTGVLKLTYASIVGKSR